MKVCVVSIALAAEEKSVWILARFGSVMFSTDDVHAVGWANRQVTCYSGPAAFDF